MNQTILDSWKKNADEWNAVIENQSIPSRQYTNRVILEKIWSMGLQRVADLGCGEGWLCRELTQNKIKAFGFDATPELIRLAKTKGNETYHQMTFEEISEKKELPNGPFDGAVFNFSIYQEKDLGLLLQSVLNSLKQKGVLLIQTLHPFYLVDNGFEYRSQWLLDSWKGLPGNFKDSHSWYARTLEDWVELISEIPDTSFKIQEVVNDEKKPISLLIQINRQDG